MLLEIWILIKLPLLYCDTILQSEINIFTSASLTDRRKLHFNLNNVKFDNRLKAMGIRWNISLPLQAFGREEILWKNIDEVADK